MGFEADDPDDFSDVDRSPLEIEGVVTVNIKFFCEYGIYDAVNDELCDRDVHKQLDRLLERRSATGRIFHPRAGND